MKVISCWFHRWYLTGKHNLNVIGFFFLFSYILMFPIAAPLKTKKILIFQLTDILNAASYLQKWFRPFTVNFLFLSLIIIDFMLWISFIKYYFLQTVTGLLLNCVCETNNWKIKRRFDQEKVFHVSHIVARHLGQIISTQGSNLSRRRSTYWNKHSETLTRQHLHIIDTDIRPQTHSPR